MPVVGAVPVSLASTKDSPQFTLVPIPELEYGAICELFDDFDSFLHSSALRHGVQFAEAGLRVSFDSASVAQYRAAMQSDEEFAEFLDQHAEMQMRYDNMDW